MKHPDKIRAVNSGPKSVIAQKRFQLYRAASTRIQQAIKSHYPLEAIALTESMIADRLEARLACIHGQTSEKRKFSTLGKLTDELCGKNSSESIESKNVFRAVKDWADLRNEAIHEMVKVAESDNKDWSKRMEEAEVVAEKGLELFKKLNALVSKLNKPGKPAATDSQTKK